MRCCRSASRTRLRRNMCVCVGCPDPTAWISCQEKLLWLHTPHPCTKISWGQQKSWYWDVRHICFKLMRQTAYAWISNLIKLLGGFFSSFWFNASCFSSPILSSPSPLFLPFLLFSSLPLPFFLFPSSLTQLWMHWSSEQDNQKILVSLPRLLSPHRLIQLCRAWCL